MLLRWLLTDFPNELRLGLRRLASEAAVWCVLAAALTVLAHLELLLGFKSGPADGGGYSASGHMVRIGAALARIAAPPLVFVIAAVRFHAQETRAASSGRSIVEAMLRRTLPAFLAWLAASAAAVLVSLAAQFAIIAAMAGMEGPAADARTLSMACRILVYVSLLTRFAFVPFIVALEHREYRKGDNQDGMRAMLYRLAWPLSTSWERTQAVAFRLLPYVFLVVYAPVAAVYVPPVARAPASFLLHLTSFTALAVLFNYYFERSTRADRDVD